MTRDRMPPMGSGFRSPGDAGLVLPERREPLRVNAARDPFPRLFDDLGPREQALFLTQLSAWRAAVQFEREADIVRVIGRSTNWSVAAQSHAAQAAGDRWRAARDAWQGLRDGLMPTRRLADIEADALSASVRDGLARLRSLRRAYTDDGWENRLRVLRTSGRQRIEDGEIDRVARLMTFDRDHVRYLGEELAALSMLPGGVRVCEIVFCAEHYPAGTEARHRLSCPKCSPDDTLAAAAGREPRGVVTTEGEI